MPTALSRLGACGGTLEGHSCRCTRALYRLCPFGLCLWPSPPRSCLPVRFRLGLGRPSPDAPRLRFRARVCPVRTGWPTRPCATGRPAPERPRAQALKRAPRRNPNFGRSAHNSQLELRELNLFRLYKRLRMWCVESLISPPRHTQSGTHRMSASQLDNKENTFSGDVRMCYERFHPAPSHPGPAHDCSTDRDVSVPARARAARRRRRL
jgi:hypothetical protein